MHVGWSLKKGPWSCVGCSTQTGSCRTATFGETLQIRANHDVTVPTSGWAARHEARRRVPPGGRSPAGRPYGGPVGARQWAVEGEGVGAALRRDARFGVLTDIDDTILQTGVQRAGHMVRQALTGSALTRTPFSGALPRPCSRGNPVFYVSSSPGNLHAFLVAFLRHRAFPLGPVLLRDLLGTESGREQKAGRIEGVLDLHPDLPFVLVADTDAVRRHATRLGLL